MGTRAGVAYIGIRSPGCPARSESLYRLSYPGPNNVLELDDTGFNYVLKRNVVIIERIR